MRALPLSLLLVLSLAPAAFSAPPAAPPKEAPKNLSQPAPTQTPPSIPPSTSKAAPLSFTLVYVSGEASRDYTRSESTLVVEGNRMTYRSSASGRARYEAPMGGKDKEITGIAIDVDAVRAALAAFDAIPKNEKLAASTFHETTYREACLTRGKDVRCVGRVNDARDEKDAEEAAIYALYMELLGKIPFDKLVGP